MAAQLDRIVLALAGLVDLCACSLDSKNCRMADVPSSGAGSSAGAGSAPKADGKATDDWKCVTYFDPDAWSHRFPDAFFTVSIPGYRKKDDHFEFELEVKCASSSWKVVRSSSARIRVMQKVKHAHTVPVPPFSRVQVLVEGVCYARQTA